MALKNLLVRDGQGNDKYIQYIGAGTATDPFVGAGADFLLNVSKGLIDGHSIVVMRGHNPTQTAVSGFVDLTEFGDLTYLTTAETMDVVSTSASDASAGVGMRTCLVQGVDDTGAAIEETVTLNGTTPVATTLSYLRVNSITGLTAGTTGWNVGDITTTASIAATTQCQIGATEGVSHSATYTVPLGFSLYVSKIEMSAAKITGGGGSPIIEMRMMARIGGNGASYVSLFTKKLDTSVSDNLIIDQSFCSLSTQLTERTDIKFRTDTDVNATESRCRLCGVLVAN